jgi:hypothetical protein
MSSSREPGPACTAARGEPGPAACPAIQSGAACTRGALGVMRPANHPPLLLWPAASANTMGHVRDCDTLRRRSIRLAQATRYFLF